MNSNLIVGIVITFSIFILATCKQKVNKTKKENDLKLNLEVDSLRVAYTYWWSNSGPFMGLCGDEYALAFLGIVREINEPIKDTVSLYKIRVKPPYSQNHLYHVWFLQVFLPLSK